MNQANFIDIWCPLCGRQVSLSSLDKHRKKKHGEVSAAKLNRMLKDMKDDGSLRDRDRRPTPGRVAGASQVLAKQRATNKLGIRRLVSGGRSK